MTEVAETDESTVVNSSSRNESAKAEAGAGTPPAYRPPQYTPPGSGPRRRVWPWVLGLLAFVIIGIGVVGIAAAVFLPSLLKARVPANANRPYRSANDNRAITNTNANENTNNESPLVNENDNGAAENEPAPTDREVVLAQLTDLENEWTVANINADKKKLERILADDYVGVTEGKSQGKAEYLRTVERDNSIQKWEFEDLKVSLLGDRATLTGIIRVQVNDQETAYNFTDKFVWRDGRWQATGSEVSPVGNGN